MNIGEFWSIIEKSRKGWDRNHPDGNQNRQLDALAELLSQLPSEEVAYFERHFQDLFYRAYRWDLWHAAFIVAEGCSDDSFMDFREWLISMGRSNYEAAVADVESVAQIAAVPGVECPGCRVRVFRRLRQCGFRGLRKADRQGVALEPTASHRTRRRSSARSRIPHPFSQA